MFDWKFKVYVIITALVVLCNTLIVLSKIAL